jgi:TolA-binding protein
VAFGADKAIMDLQRDVAQLQDTVKQLQRSQDEKFGAILELVKQLVGNSNEASKAVAVMQSGLQQSLQDTQSKVVTPVAGLSTRMDQMSNDLNKVENAVSDLAPILAKIQTQLNDLNNNVKVLQAPAPAPPAPAGTAPGGSAVALPSMPPISATDLYNNADRDRSGGHLDLALQEFSDYLKYYGNTAQAPAAQFYIGFIHYGQKDFETAAQDFDLVLEKYPTDIARVPEATYYKGMSLERITGHRTEASQEYKELIKQFPDSDYAKKACTELQVLGLRCSAPTTAPPAKSAAKKKK